MSEEHHCGDRRQWTGWNQQHPAKTGGRCANDSEIRSRSAPLLRKISRSSRNVCPRQRMQRTRSSPMQTVL